MKKTILFCAMIMFATINAFAQIPNNGFESWTTIGAYEVPDNWGTMNNTTAPLGVYTATKATPGSIGTYYMKLTSKTYGATVINGVATCGKLDSITMRPISGFAFNQQPVSLTGKYQHMIVSTSTQGSIKAWLTHWNTGTNQRDTVAVASQTLVGMHMSWSNFTVNFNYLSSTVPDSAMILLSASGAVPTNSDYLWVDNLTFSGSVAGISNYENFLNSMVVYPNPTTENIQLELDFKTPQQTMIELYDMQGRLVYVRDAGTLSGQTIENMDVSTLPKGNYSLLIATPQGQETKKIIIE